MKTTVDGSNLSRLYDLVMLDLDGVVYRGEFAVPEAIESLRESREHGTRLAFLTNNASRPAKDVANRLRELGLSDVADEDVVTSAQAVAHMMADQLSPDSPVLVIGGEGLRVALRERGLAPVDSLDEDPVAVVQGFHPDLGWRDLAKASYAVARGLPWFASNTDMTVPTQHGLAPGNGSLVQAVANAVGQRPVVAGKPEPALFDETLDRMKARRPIMVGDRLDTDIDGALNAGIDSLLVLTGVNTLQDAAALPKGRRPTFVAPDLRALLVEHADVIVNGRQASCGQATARLIDGSVEVSGGSALEQVRSALSLAWTVLDQSGRSPAINETMTL